MNVSKSALINFSRFAFSLCFILFFVKQSHTASIQVTPVRDNSIYEENGSRSNALGGLFSGRTNGGGGTLSRRSLFAFDVSAIPFGSSVDSVSLQLELIQTGDAVARVMDLHRLTSAWGEGTSSGGGQGGIATTNDATWTNNFFPSSLWSSPGGDFQAAPSDSISVGSVGTYQWSSANLINDVQSWVDNAANNNGWILIGEESLLGTTRVFASRENNNINIRPLLTVEFTVVPEPQSIVLFFFGLVSTVIIINLTSSTEGKKHRSNTIIVQ